MPDHFGHNRGELAKAQLILEDAESKLERLHSLILERRTERQSLSSLIQDIAATGDMDKLVSLQSRAVALEKALAELSSAETDCSERVQSARRYLYTLYVRLEKLRQEFSNLMRQLAAVDQGDNIPSDVQTNLGRVKIQLKAITGENSTGRL